MCYPSEGFDRFPTARRGDRRSDLSGADFRAPADFRYRIRRFLHFREEAARAEGLEPQQHQMMLAIRTLDDGAGPAIGAVAEHLFIRHHSAVGPIHRLEERRLVKRASAEPDRRMVRVKLTPEGEQIFRRLAQSHRTELRMPVRAWWKHWTR